MEIILIVIRYNGQLVYLRILDSYGGIIDLWEPEPPGTNIDEAALHLVALSLRQLTSHQSAEGIQLLIPRLPQGHTHQEIDEAFGRLQEHIIQVDNSGENVNSSVFNSLTAWMNE